MTLCAKNLQGTIAHNYQEHCRQLALDMDIISEHVQPNARKVIMANYKRHLEMKIPRMDRDCVNIFFWNIFHDTVYENNDIQNIDK